MKNSLRKIVLAAMMTVAPLAASEYTFQTHSLLGIEGSYSETSVDVITGTPETHDEDAASLGFKIGAQSENYRVFLGARAYDAENLSYLNTYGAEIQYLFNFSKFANFYLGGSGGLAKYKVPHYDGYSAVAADSMYYGGDAGFNIHATELIDLEIGARVISIQDGDVVQGTKVYEFDRIVSAYASVIIKWEMD